MAFRQACTTFAATVASVSCELLEAPGADRLAAAAFVSAEGAGTALLIPLSAKLATRETEPPLRLLCNISTISGIDRARSTSRIKSAFSDRVVICLS